MKVASVSALVIAGIFSSCAYDPLKDRDLYAGPRPATTGPRSGVRATFLGNTTILVSDGSTHLLVDGFFSRPGAIQTLVGKIAPDPKVIREELKRAGITKVDAVLVGHAHHDHSLDAPLVADITKAVAVGSASYRFIHEGAGGKTDEAHLITLKSDREEHRFGKFTVTFVASEHVHSHSFVQRKVEGEITRPLKTPARFSDFKCGQVYAIHIAHPEGNLAVTTTAGARPDQFGKLRSDILFLGVGLLAKEPESRRNLYWKETVGTLDPAVVVPVHWDEFTRPLSKGLKPRARFADDVKGALDWVKAMGKCRQLRVMDAGDVIDLRKGEVR